MMERIDAAIAVQQQGDNEGARRLFEDLWQALGPAGDPLCRCRLAHHMADLQEDPEEELAWDLRALEAAAMVTDERVASQHASLSVAAFYPSLYLNVAEDYRKLERFGEAREYLIKAQRSMDILPTTGYGGLIRDGIARLADRLSPRSPEQ